MGFTRLLRNLARDEHVGPRVVPIIPDEARTFGMDALFRELKIYAALGQKYEPVDHDLLLSYTESANGQILEEGITEAGSMASFIAAGTSYAHRGVPMVPFYTFYSMFGFQRVGDLIWQAADARARGFLLGATAGRTTLLGEGLQHQDGHSLVLASTVPAVQAYDPAFAYEVAAIVQAGHPPHVRPGHAARRARRLLLPHALQRELRDAADARGRPRRRSRPASSRASTAGRPRPTARATGPRCCSPAAPRAPPARPPPSSPSTSTSAPSCGRRRATSACARTPWPTARWNRLHPEQPARTPRVAELLGRRRRARSSPSPTSWPSCPSRSPASCPAGRSRPLGTDGMGRSDTREALRRFFEVDAGHVVVATLAGARRPGRRQAGGRHRRHRPLRHRPRGRQPLPRLTIGSGPTGSATYDAAPDGRSDAWRMTSGSTWARRSPPRPSAATAWSKSVPLTTYSGLGPVRRSSPPGTSCCSAGRPSGAARRSRKGLAREFKRRVGDPVPLMLSGSPYHADRLTALMAQWATAAVAEQIGGPADRVVITHPANWTEYQLGTLRNALARRRPRRGRADLRAGGRGDRLRRRRLRWHPARRSSSTTSAAERSTSPCCAARARRSSTSSSRPGSSASAASTSTRPSSSSPSTSVPREVLEAARQHPEGCGRDHPAAAAVRRRQRGAVVRRGERHPGHAARTTRRRSASPAPSSRR